MGGSGAGRDSACYAGRLRPPPPWDRSDSAAAVLRGRRPRARWARSAAFPSGSAKARIWRILASILRMSWHQLKACTAQIAQFVHGIRILAICSCGGILQICQWYRVCDAGALRAEPLATLYILRGQNTSFVFTRVFHAYCHRRIHSFANLGMWKQHELAISASRIHR